MGLADKVAIITGGGEGIGYAIAEGLVNAGARVVVCGRREAVLQEAVKKLGSQADYVVGDVSDADQSREIIEQTVSRYGALHYLVNNAAVRLAGAIGQMPIEQIDASLAVNLRGPILMAHWAVPHLAQAEGSSILNVSSASGRSPALGTGVYGATKSALIHLTRVWAAELAPQGIRVNCISPGPTLTPAFKFIQDNFVPNLDDIAAAETVIGRVADSREMMPPALMLLDDEQSSYVTGAVLDIDGGYHMLARRL
ncbi:MAG: SDR family oxidoreductase [Anaerolineaceae bacterium]|nr:MAG: SDR family oxidoreductase [Anaerolineaceae bacterium]